MSERQWTQGTHGRCNVVSFDGEEIRPVATFVLAEEAELACRLQSENAELRAQVERLEAAKLRLRDVVKSVEHVERINPLNNDYYQACPSCRQAEPQHFTDCQLAAVLRETEVDNNQGEDDA